jgi:hypothetical protein
MAISPYIPQYDPAGSTGMSSLSNAFFKAKQQALQNQEVQQQMSLQEQLARLQEQKAQQDMAQAEQMNPLLLQKMKLGISGYPAQQQMKMDSTALSWAKGVIDANSKDPNFSSDPSNKQSLAQAMQIQNQYLGKLYGSQGIQQPQQQNSQASPIPIGQQLSNASNIGNEDGASLSPEYQAAIDRAQKAKEGQQLSQQYTTDELNRISRMVAAKKAYDDIGTELREVLPYLGPGNSLSMVAKNYSMNAGIPLDKATIKINTLFNKKIPGLSKEMAPAFGTPSAEKAYENFSSYVDPSAFGQPDQILSNYNAVGDLLNNVGSTLLKTPAEQIQEGKELFSKKSENNVPRGTKSTTGDHDLDQLAKIDEILRARGAIK